MLGLGHRVTTLAVMARLGGIAVSSPISAIAADGMQAAMRTPADLAYAPIAVSRAGFDSGGHVTTHSRTVRTTKRVRQPYPNHALKTADAAALSRNIYSSDSVPGAVNLSTLKAPKPVAAWALGHRTAFTVTPEVEVVAGHLDAEQGKQIAGVRFIASDGVNPPIEQFVSTPVISGRAGDKVPLPVYRLTADCSALANGPITVNAEVVPHIGTDSVTYADSCNLKSAEETALNASPRGFKTLHFHKKVRPFCYVSTTGNNATGVWSTDDATARANPFLTMRGAIQGAQKTSSPNNNAVTAFTTEGLNGLELRFQAGSFVLQGDTAARASGIAGLLLTRDPLVAKSAVTLTFGASAYQVLMTAPSGFASAAVTIRGVTVQRTDTGGTAAQITSGAAAIWFDDVDYDTRGLSTAIGASATVDIRMSGVRIFNSLAGGALAATSLGQVATRSYLLLRGVEADMNGGAIEGYCMMASRIVRPGLITFGGRGEGASGAVFARNILSDPAIGADGDLISFGLGENVSGLYLSHVLIDWPNPGGSVRTLGISRDDGTGDTDNIIVEHVTAPAYWSHGRWNIFYDDTVAEARSHTRSRVTGCIMGQVNLKNDIFAGSRGAVDASTRRGSWPASYGVNWSGNFVLWNDANNSGGSDTVLSSFSPEFVGVGSKRNASNSAATDPGFVGYTGQTGSGGVAVAGTLGSDFHLSPGAAARGIVAEPVRAFDFAGTAVNAGEVDAAGVYA